MGFVGGSQQLPQRFCVRRQKQAILLAAGRRFRFHDVGQPGNRNVDTIDDEHTPFVPDGFEVETGHDERQIDLEIAPGRSDERPPSDNRIGDELIVTSGFAGIPGPHQVVGIGREKEITILCGEDRRAARREVVCAGHTNQNKTDSVCGQFARDWRKVIGHSSRAAERGDSD